MKQYLTKGALALVLGGFLTSCSHEEFDISTYVADKVKAYEQVFVSEFGSIDPNQDWGFGTTATEAQARSGLTRADHSWDGKHSCAADWSKLNFTKPEGAIDLTRSDLFPDGNNLGSQFQNVENWYIPADFNGSLSLHGMNLKGNVYVLGKLTDLQSVNYNGTVTFYVAKDATLKYTVSSGNRHNIINAGNLEVAKWSNVGELYNGGTLTITDTDVHNDAKIYSKSEATIEFPYGGDLKSTCDIHGTINVTGNLKIQNSTSKYICGIIATGSVENVDGPLYTSYVKANYFSSDGNPIYLTAGGYINVATTIKIYNAKCLVYAATGSTALIKTRDFIFENDNDLDRTFSDEIHFNITGSIDCSAATNLPGGDSSKKVYTVAEYIAQFGDPNERINTGNASGSPACGEAWSIGTGGGGGEIELPIDKSETTGNTIKVVTTEKFYKTTELVEQGRVFCEDLGQISSNDLDFNDVVFDAYVYRITTSTQTIVEEDGEVISNETVEDEPTYKTAIVLLAAGGTLELNLAGVEVHNTLGNNPTSTIINTITSADESYHNQWTTYGPMVLGEDFSYSSIVEIPIIVRYGNGEILELTAQQGWAPHKILVPIGTKWCKERVNIADAYKSFNDYVGTSLYFWEGEIDDTKLYPSDVTYTLTTEIGTVSNGADKVTEYERTDGETTTGGYNGTEVLSRERR